MGLLQCYNKNKDGWNLEDDVVYIDRLRKVLGLFLYHMAEGEQASKILLKLKRNVKTINKF